VIEALALRRPPPTTAYVHRIGDLARDRDLPAPNYSTVRSVVAAIDPGLRTPAHDGDAAYRNQFELIHRCTAARPNEQWQADHTLLDLQILDIKQQPARPWLTIVLDDYFAQLVADAAASSALQVAHATAVEGHLPVPGATVVRAGRSQPWLVVAAGVDRVQRCGGAGEGVADDVVVAADSTRSAANTDGPLCGRSAPAEGTVCGTAIRAASWGALQEEFVLLDYRSRTNARASSTRCISSMVKKPTGSVRRLRSTVASWSHMTRVCRSAMATGGRKLVSRALVLVKATIQVLSASQSGCNTTAYRRPFCSWPLPRAGSR